MNGTDGGARQIIYEFARAAELEGWWVWALLVGSLAILMYGCVKAYRRDTEELRPQVRWTLIVLRLVTIVALIFFFFNLQRRTQRLITRPSEAVILVDTSQSMSLPAGTVASQQTRAERAVQLLGKSDLLETLSEKHRVSVYAFAEEAAPRLLETRGGDLPRDEEEAAPAAPQPKFRLPALLGALALVIAAVLGFSSLMLGATGRADSASWLLGPTAAMMVIGIVCLGSVFAIHTEQSLAEILGVQGTASIDEPIDETPEPNNDPIRVTNWEDAIAAAGSKSRIGDAIRSVLADHDPATLAGIVLVTDGQSNGGIDSTLAMTSARRSEVALYPVGLGSSDAPVNVRVVDLDAPRRVYPGDKFSVSGVLQASGPKAIEVEVQLLDALDDDAATNPTGSDPGNDPAQFSGEVVDSKKVKVLSDGTLTGIRFELEPETVGRRRLAIRVVAPPEDQNSSDDLRDARYEVVARKLRVMAIAGGPTREYRFVRNLLHRDKSIELDVWLQSGQTGISQDADKVLASFPAKPEELFEYDAIVLFDPDWTALTGDALNMMDRWLAQQAGGMVLVAGPVYHPRWTKLRTDPRVVRISGFYPVNFPTRGPLLGGGRQGGENPWPIEFTPEARRSEFLWINDDPQLSFETWDRFGGVFDYVGVKNPKPGAKVYGYFSDPTTEIGDSLPVYLASQFYGAGRVYFQGSGEMWRLRGESDAFFDSYYTKLIRWVSEGRLLRDSNRGVLLVDPRRAMVGDTISIRAVLTDEQFEPLDVPEVPAKLLAPGGRIEDISLLPLKGEPRAGTYGGRFIVREAGSYELRVTLGDALDEQVLRQSVQVGLPLTELKRPRRNDAELQQLATMTGGKYFPVEDDSTTSSIKEQVVATLRPQPQTTVLPGTPDQDFNERRNAILMWLIASVITMEWVTRRLHRLA